uniref:ZAD domain-containing protein n=1 Tax=Anopheles dirus TaxID=7168 RepID=A0A182N6U4_9DIPT
MTSLEPSCCRLCLNKPNLDSLVFSVFDTFQGKVLSLLVEELFGIHVFQHDRLQSVCLDCVNRINTVLKIKQLFVANDSKLNKLQLDAETAGTFVEEIVYSVFPGITDDSSAVKNDESIILEPSQAIQTDAQNDEDCKTDAACPTAENSVVIVAMGQEAFDEGLEMCSDSDDIEDTCKKTRNDNPVPNAKTTQPSQPIQLPQNKCYFCGKIFSTPLEFTQHLPEHFDQTPYACIECDGQVFKSVREASKHIAFHDAIERPYKCRICSLRFPTRVNSLTHERKLHRLKQKRMEEMKMKRTTAKRRPTEKRASHLLLPPVVHLVDHVGVRMTKLAAVRLLLLLLLLLLQQTGRLMLARLLLVVVVVVMVQQRLGRVLPKAAVVIVQMQARSFSFFACGSDRVGARNLRPLLEPVESDRFSTVAVAVFLRFFALFSMSFAVWSVVEEEVVVLVPSGGSVPMLSLPVGDSSGCFDNCWLGLLAAGVQYGGWTIQSCMILFQSSPVTMRNNIATPVTGEPKLARLDQG